MKEYSSHIIKKKNLKTTPPLPMTTMKQQRLDLSSNIKIKTRKLYKIYERTVSRHWTAGSKGL